MTNMKQMLAELKAAEEATNKVDKQWDAEPENEALAAEWREAYKREMDAYFALREEIGRVTGGKISPKDAGLMIRAKRAELEALIARMEG